MASDVSRYMTKPSSVLRAKDRRKRNNFHFSLFQGFLISLPLVFGQRTYLIVSFANRSHRLAHEMGPALRTSTNLCLHDVSSGIVSRLRAECSDSENRIIARDMTDSEGCCQLAITLARRGKDLEKRVRILWVFDFQYEESALVGKGICPRGAASWIRLGGSLDRLPLCITTLVFLCLIPANGAFFLGPRQSPSERIDA